MKNVARLILGRTLVMVMLGNALGLGLGMASVRFIDDLLYGVRASDASVMLLPAIVIMAVSCLAAIAPLLHAEGIDPAAMLRAQ